MTTNQAGNQILNLHRDVDEFTRAYIETALWSSYAPKYGECPCCGKMAVLDRLPETEFDQVPMCSADGCGVKEMYNDDPMDENYNWTDIAPETLARMIEDCRKFQADHQATIDDAMATGEVKYGPDFSAQGRAGHDFWLTREGHGAGFWDGGWPETAGDVLTKASKSFGEFNLYIGDDGKIHN